MNQYEKKILNYMTCEFKKDLKKQWQTVMDNN